MNVTRRAFVAASLTAALGLTGCGNNSSPVTEDITDKIPFTSYTFNEAEFILPKAWEELGMDAVDTDGFISNEDDGGKFFFCIADSKMDYSKDDNQRYLMLYAETIADAYWTDYKLQADPDFILDSDYGVVNYDVDVYKNDEISEKGKMFVAMRDGWIIHGYIVFAADSYENDQQAIAEKVAENVCFNSDWDFGSTEE